MTRILIKGATIVPITGPEQIILNGELAIEGDVIKAVGPAGTVDASWSADKVIDGQGKLVIPGFINCHTHAAMTLLRSYADDLPLMDWLKNKIWPVEDNLIAEDIYWGTMLSVAEMIKSGTTTFLDMYFHMDQVGKVAEETGIRAVLSRGMIGFGEKAKTSIQEARDLKDLWHNQADGRITVMLGPHAPYTCPPDFLKEVKVLAQQLGLGIHIHLAETLGEVEDIRKEYGKRPIELMNELGLFDGTHVVAAHCVHLTDGEIAILAEKGVGVAHNPESNMKLASGIAPVPKMLEQGVKVGLGTDGASSNNNLDMLQEMRSAALIHKVNAMDATVVPAYQALEMATLGGARVLGLDNEIGSLKPGFKADLLILDLEKPHLYPHHDVVANLVYSAQAADIDTVIINGKIVMENRQLLTMNEKAVLQKAQEHTNALLARSNKQN
jgi:5-methylthioadenosine/S-adenosylhomocysteine deaminase